MAGELSRLEWHNLRDTDVDGAWLIFTQTIKDQIRMHIPKTKPNKTSKKSAPWWKNNLAKAVKAKHRLWKKYVLSNSDEDHMLYVKQRNKTTNLIRTARQAYEDQLIKDMKHEPKKAFQICKSTTKG